jgi:O-antigen ligase
MYSQNKIVQVFLLIIGLMAALWVITVTADMRLGFQVAFLIASVVAAVIFGVARSLPFDFKLLAVALLGYALGGKGFAYVTPVEPIYIGEIALIVCLVGFCGRLIGGLKLLPTFAHKVVFFWIAAVAIYLLFSFGQYKLLAIRDSAVGYYGLFFFFAFGIFQNPKALRAFIPMLKGCVLFAYIGSFLLSTGIYHHLAYNKYWLKWIFVPHPDAFIPLLVGGASYGIIRGVSRRSLLLLAMGFVGMLLLLMTKTAGIFALATSFALLLVFTKRIELMVSSAAIVLIALVGIGFLFAVDSSSLRETILGSDQVQTLYELGSAQGSGNTSTTDWRLTWWKVIAEDTMRVAPVFGTGMGSDITTSFLTELFGREAAAQTGRDYARYPHSIIFTVLGRMGLLGLGLFLLLFGFLLRFGARFARHHLRGRTEGEEGGLLPFMVFYSGLMNALVQATYEVPHGAILHWVCLGYLAAYHMRATSEENQALPVPQGVPAGLPAAS